MGVRPRPGAGGGEVVSLWAGGSWGRWESWAWGGVKLPVCRFSARGWLRAQPSGCE